MKKLLYLTFLFILVFSSCEELMDIKFDGDENKRLVIDGLITTDTTVHTVILSRTGDFFNKTAQDMETGASVSITDGTEVFTLTEVEPGIYNTDNTVYGEVGKTYTLNVTTLDGEDYTASETIYDLPVIDSIKQSVNYFHQLYYMNWVGEGYDILYYGPEPEGLGDYYLWHAYLEDTLYTDTVFESMFTDDEFVDGNYIKDFEVLFIRDIDVKKDSVKVTVEMHSISDEYYEYMIGLRLETVWKGSPWDGPPANVPTNISNNALGYFRAAHVQRKSIYLKKGERRW